MTESQLNSSISTPEEKVEETKKSSSRGPFLNRALAYMCVFLVALFASMAHDFLEPNTRTVFFADSRNYQRSSNYICTAFMDAMKGKDVRPYLKQEHIAARIENDGPILSTVLATIFTVIGHPPESKDWKVFVTIQCVIHAVTAVLVVALVVEFIGSIRWGTAAGLAFALYPGGLIASGRVMTETLSCLLCTAYLLLLLASTRRMLWSPLCGFIAGLAWTMKVVLIPPVITALLFLAGLKKLKPAAIAVIVAGIFVVVTPWALFSKDFLQRTMITTERASVHNAYIGWDTETDGFQASFPTPKERMLLVHDPISVIWGQVLSEPTGTFLLTLEKFARYYGLPFNDFRHQCYGISSTGLIPIHLLYLFLGALGVVMYAAGGYRRLSDSGRLACNLTLVVLFFMQCYFLFEANTRYGYTSFPLLCAFGALGLWICLSLFRQKNWFKLSWTVATASLLTFLVFNSETLVKMSEPKQTVHSLQPGQKAQAVIDLKSITRASNYALVLVDGSEGLSSAEVQVNGHVLPDRLISLAYLDSKRFTQFNLMKEYGYGLKAPVEELRQWRAAIVPIEWLNERGKNTIDIKARSQTNIYGDKKQNYRRFRSLDAVCVNRLLYTPTDLEARPFEPVQSAGVEKSFSIDGSGSGKQTIGGESLRIYLAFLQPMNVSVYRKSVGDEKAVEQSFTQADFPLLMRVHNSDEITSSKFIVSHSVTNVNAKIPRYKQATHARITLTGDVRSAAPDGQAGIAISTGGDSDLFWMLARLPYSIPCGKEWKPFTISDLVPMDAFKGRATQVGIGIYPGPWPEVMGLGPAVAGPQVSLKNLRLKIEPVASLDMHGSRLMVY